jgi:DNA helicase II / ATP-dependent DNA helicase PcrA
LPAHTASTYRSTQPILDISKTLIDKNQERLVKQIEGLSKELVASNSKISHLTHQPVIREYNSVKEEMAGITMEVEALLHNGVAAGKIAVIYKENKYGEELANFFRLKGVPFYSKKNINILLHPFIKKVMQLLRYLNAEHDIPYGGDEMLFEILHYDFYKIPPIEIAKLTVEVNQKKYSGELTSIRKLLSDKTHAAPKDLFDTGMHSALARTGTMLEKLIAEVPNLTLQQLFANMVQQAGILAYIMQSPDKIQLLQLLNALFDFIKTETSRNPSLQLSDFIDIISLMEKEQLALPMVQLSGSEKGINLLTAHGSKGLEFEYVFVAGTNASFWEKKRSPAGGYKLPDTMFSTATTTNAGHVEEELRRLFYVALTRAEKHLHISYAKLRNDGKELEPSMFIAEIQQVHQLPVEKIALPLEDLLAFESLHFTAQAPEIQKAEDDFIDGLLAKFMMNVTALNNYLKCPLQFYYQSLIRIPAGKNEATEFGSAVHHALEKLFRAMQEGGKEQFPPKAAMIEDFKWYLRRHRENFTPEAKKYWPTITINM